MKIKYNLEMNNTIIQKRINKIINQVYKLLPTREQGQNWEKPLQTLIEELSGMERLLNIEDDLFFLILCKMEGLFSLKDDVDMSLYRRTIFQCLTLLNNLSKNVENIE